MRDIELEYKRLYKVTLDRALHSETSGAYRKLLLEMLLIDEFNPEKDAKSLRKVCAGGMPGPSLLMP